MLIISKNYRAFSFIELMAVVAIIGIMSAVAFVSLQSTKTNSRLGTAQREVASAIKLAQSYALEGKIQNGATPCGYGFRFINATNYEIFYNPPGGAGEECAKRNTQIGFRRYTGISVSAESYNLKNSVALSSAVADAELYFTVPHANIFSRTGQPYGAAQTFAFSFSGVTKSIIFSPAGYVTEN